LGVKKSIFTEGIGKILILYKGYLDISFWHL
jgi:hypothetical protein